MKLANWDVREGDSSSLSEISAVLPRIFHPFTRLCVWMLTRRPVWIILSGHYQEMQTHFPAARRERRAAPSPSLVSMATKG